MKEHFVATGFEITLANPKGILDAQLTLSDSLRNALQAKDAVKHRFVVVAYDVNETEDTPKIRISLLPSGNMMLRNFKQGQLLKGHEEIMWAEGLFLSSLHVKVVGLYVEHPSEKNPQGVSRIDFERSALNGCHIIPEAKTDGGWQDWTVPLGVGLRKVGDRFQTVALGKERGRRVTFPFDRLVASCGEPTRYPEAFHLSINHTQYRLS
jgi:DNA-directed RNA polymerase subunit L